MQTLKSILLPIMGMLFLLMFIIFAYIQDSVFLDKILVCSFILTIVFIARMRCKAQRKTSNKLNFFKT